MQHHEGSLEAACLAIENLSVGSDAVRQMLEDGNAVDPVVAILGSAKIEARTRAARALTALAQNSAVKQAAANKGAFVGLATLLKMAAEAGQRDDVQEAAARCITQLAAREEAAPPMVAEAGAVTLLVTNLSSKHVQVQDSAALALWAVAGHPRVKQQLIDSGAMDVLVRVVGQGAIARLNRGESRAGRRDMRDQNFSVEREVIEAVRGLVDLLCQGTDGGKKDAAWGLVNLSKTHPNRVAVAQAGAVPLLVNVIVYGTQRAQAAAAWALWCLSRTLQSMRVRSVPHRSFRTGRTRETNESPRADQSSPPRRPPPPAVLPLHFSPPSPVVPGRRSWRTRSTSSSWRSF